MKKVLSMLIIFVFAFITGCAVSWNLDKQATMETAACEAGYQMAKHLPDEAVVVYKYTKTALESDEVLDFNEQFKIWKEYALEKAGLNKHYARQLNKFLPDIELQEGAIPTGEWMKKAKPLLEEFKYGIEDGLDELGIPYEGI
jgi:hypothetical protein